MSIKYNDKFVVGLSDNIDDNTPSNITMYSSKQIDTMYRYFQQQIYSLKYAAKGVRDIVGSLDELNAYDKSTLIDQDVINVLSDADHGNSNSYYRYNATTDSFEYVGDIGSYYTKTEFNEKIDVKEFVLDSGNTIKTINGESVLGSGNLQVQTDLDTYYPVGYIWQTTSEENPANIFGGEWQKLEDCSLVGAGGEYVVGDKGGEYTVLLEDENIPSHTHTSSPHSHSITVNNGVAYDVTVNFGKNETGHGLPMCRSVNSNNNDGQYDDIRLYKGKSGYLWYYDVDWLPVMKTINNTNYNQRGTITINATTGSLLPLLGVNSHDNMPPCIIINMWQRIA